MAVPKVQSLEEIIAQYEPGYANTRNLYNQQIQALPGQYDAQRAAVEGKRTTGFRDIARSANSRGLDFWGTPIAEQNEYLSDVYLPGMQAANAGENKDRLSLQMALAGLDTDIRNNAMGARQQQQSAFNSWQENERRMKQERDLQSQRLAHDSSMSAGKGGVDLKIAKNARGGWEVLENGQRSRNYDLASASAALGKDLIALLSQGDKQDKQAAKWYQDNIRLGRKQEYALQRLLKDRSTAFYLGGAYAPGG